VDASHFLGSGTVFDLSAGPRGSRSRTIPDVVFIIECRFIRTDLTSGTSRVWSRVNARVSTSTQDLDRQVDALQAMGIDPARIYLDKKSGSTVERPGLRAVTGYARAGDVIVVHTLDRLGRTVRDTLNLIHELAERGVGVRNLADPIKVGLREPGRSDGPARGSAISSICANGADLHGCSQGKPNTRHERISSK